MKNIALVLALSSISGVALAEDCTSLFNELYGYAQPAKIGNCAPNFNTVKVKVVTNRNDSKYASYSEGFALNKSLLRICRPGVPCPPASLTGDTTQQFSDRTSYVYPNNSCSPGTLCVGDTQNFTVQKTDVLGVSVSASQLVFTLKSWGNGTVAVPVACANRMMYGEKDGTFYVASFEKTVYTNICIR